MLPAGFYYKKTFMWPRGAWMSYKNSSAARQATRRQRPIRTVTKSVLTIAMCWLWAAALPGIAAALAAGDAGARVLLVEERAEVGGQLTYGGGIIDGTAAAAWRRLARAKLAEMPEVRVLTRTTAVGYYDHNLVTLLERITDHLPPRPAGELHNDYGRFVPVRSLSPPARPNARSSLRTTICPA